MAGIACAALLGAPPPAASAAYMPLELQAPGAGQTTVGIAQLRFHGAAPKRLGVRLRNKARLGHSLGGIYAIFRKRRGDVTAFTFVTLLLRRKPSAAAASDAPASASRDEEEEEDDLGIFFTFGGSPPDGYTTGGMATSGHGRDRTDLFTIVQQLGDDASIAKPKKARRLLEYGNVEEPPASSSADLGDSLLDTGHYDDGHSFGWHTAGVKQAVGDWLHLSADNASYEELIEKIESRLGEDLDGDREVSDGRGGGGTLETEVGAPVIK